MKSVFLLICFFCSTVIIAADTLIPYRKGTKWGYANVAGVIVVKPVYTSVSHQESSIAHIVALNGKYGLLNAAGKKITELVYDNLIFMQSDLGLIATQKGKKGVMDNDGKMLLPCSYDEIDYFPDRREVTFGQGNKRGTYSLTTKKIITAPQADDRMVAEEVMAQDDDEAVATRVDLRYYIVAAGNKSKIGKEAKTITFRNGSPVRKRISTDTLSFTYDRIIPLNYYKLPAILFQENNQWGIILNDVVAVPPAYDSISTAVINHACEAFYFQVMDRGKWGIIDAHAQVTTPLIYDAILHPGSMRESGMSCYDTRDGIMVKNADRSGLISVTGEILVPVAQEAIIFRDKTNYHVYIKDNRKGVYNARFNSGPVFTLQEEVSELVDFDGTMVLKVIDSKRMVPSKWNGKEPYLIGYVSSTGVRFYED